MNTLPLSKHVQKIPRLFRGLSKAAYSVLTTVLLLATMITSTTTGLNVAAQTDFDIASKKPDTEIEYREELDKWMLRALEGDRDAQFKVGMLFTNKQFSEPDFEQAAYWYKQAARQEHVLAQYNLGHQYLTGLGVERNETTAMRWWLKAANNDYPLAQFNVGRAYYLGIGLPKDHKESRRWFELAAKNQEPKSIEILAQLGWIEPEQLAQINTDINNVEQAGIEQQDTNVKKASLADASADSELVSHIIPTAPPKAANATKTNSTQTNNTVIVNQQDALNNAGTTDNQVNNDNVQSRDTTPPAKEVAAPSTANAIALYTNPNIRDVLIAIVDDKKELNILKVGKNWIRVSVNNGFPVWVNENYVAVTGNTGTITGSSVNARSVPIVTSGTVAGKLKKNETVTILDKNKDWYRILSPNRFVAWVKKDDYDHDNIAGTPSTEPENASKWRAAKDTAETDQSELTEIGSDTPDSNRWLYSRPSDHYTLQLASFDDLDKVAKFVSRQKFIDNPNLHRFTSIGKNDIKWTYFLYGQYQERELAELAKEEIQQKRAWIRTFGKLQQNRCVAWKRQLPTPKELNQYCAER